MIFLEKAMNVQIDSIVLVFLLVCGLGYYAINKRRGVSADLNGQGVRFSSEPSKKSRRLSRKHVESDGQVAARERRSNSELAKRDSK